MADAAVKIPLVYEHSTDDQSTLGLGHVEHVISCQVESVYDQFPQMTLICEYTQSNADRLPGFGNALAAHRNRWSA